MRSFYRKSSLLYAILFVSLATFFSLAFERHLQRTALFPFVLAVVFSSWKGGSAGGIFATALSLVSLHAQLGFAELPESRADDAIVLLVFVTVSIVMGTVVSRLRASTERLSYTLEFATDGFWDWDVRTGEVFFSPRWISSLGYEPGEISPVLGSWQRLVHPDDWERTTAALREHFEGRVGIYEVENRLLEKTGRWRWNLDRGKIVERDWHGRPVRMVGVDIDISAAKMAAEEAAARKALEVLNVEKDRVLGLVSHELRNPLNAISMALRSVRPGRRTPEKVDLALRVIDSAVKQQAMLVDDLLDRARLNNGKFELLAAPVSLREVVDSALAVVARDAERKRITIETDLKSGTETLIGDERRLTQVLWNLLSNAVKFTPPGGRVSVRASSNGELSIAVTDTGRGIEEEAIPHLFEPYWQVRSEDSEMLGGLGLGLALANEIVERAGGRIEVRSAGLGKGATFDVRLPETAVVSPRAGNE